MERTIARSISFEVAGSLSASVRIHGNAALGFPRALSPSGTRFQAGIIIAICLLHLTVENFFSIPNGMPANGTFRWQNRLRISDAALKALELNEKRKKYVSEASILITALSHVCI